MLVLLPSHIYFTNVVPNRYLRGYFQKYLTNNFTEETLLFWEHAEDYWRAHPYSPHRLTPCTPNGVNNNISNISGGGASGGGAGAAASTGVTSANARASSAFEILEVLNHQDAVMLSSPAVVRQWAESIFLAFLHSSAPYLIGSCTARDMARIEVVLDNLSSADMPPYNLFRSVQLATFQFMKSECYPDFVAHPQYHRLLVAAVHAADRVRSGVT